jgi:high-affinity Fe2+/Pb2+ permease
MPALLDHLEKTASDNYRKEIDQEENVWRTLPFFVAALAVEVAALTQVKDQFKALTGTMATAAWIIGIFAFLCMIVVVFYLWRSIF